MSDDQTADTYAIVRARLAAGRRIGDSDIVQLCDEIERLRAWLKWMAVDDPDAQAALAGAPPRTAN